MKNPACSKPVQTLGVGMQEAHKISAGVELKQVNAGKQQKRRRESWSAAQPLQSITEYH